MSSWTILFTDIEGSTRLWETQPEAMSRALHTHDTIARRAVERHLGKVVKTLGDGVHAVFGDPVDGVNAAVDLQCALADPAATQGIPLRIRCGLHVGDVEQRDEDFFGSPVNRSARIMGAAHGGQILLSRAVADGVAGRLPDEISLRDLGELRLKGLDSLEHVYQVVHRGLRQDFPPLQSLETTPNNLPNPVTTFIGRDRELRELGDRLKASRLLTLWGMGGLGKTRLALQLAANALDDFPDGAWFVDLAPLRDASLVPATLARVLSVQEEPGRSLVDALCAHLRTRKLLVILDNCEHLVDACARLADRVLSAAADVQIVATTREPLRIAAERTYPILPLPLPDPHQTVESLQASDAVRLFIDRARAHDPAFEFTSRDASVIARIVAQLEGIPLALELAAARIRALSLAAIDARLNDRFKLLTQGGRVTLERQQTLRATVGWSYGLLDDHEKTLFDRLGVFAGGFDLDACEHVCAADPVEPDEVLDLLSSLVEKSLVMAERLDGEARYRTLDTIRDYARERLHAEGALVPTAERHCAHYFDLAKNAGRGLGAPDRAAWIQRLDRELDNIRAAESFCLQPGGDPIVATKIEVALMAYRTDKGHATEGRALLRRLLLSAPVRDSPVASAWALYSQGALAMSQGDLAESIDSFRRSLQLRRIDGRPVDLAATLSSLALALVHAGAVDEASAHEEEALSLFRELGDKQGEAITALHLGEIALRNQTYDVARSWLDEAIELARALGNREFEAESEGSLGMVALESGDPDEARRRFERSLEISRSSSNSMGEAQALRGLGLVHLAEGDLTSSRRHLHAALVAFQAFEGRAAAIPCIEDCARLELRSGNATSAVRLLAAAAALRGSFSIARSSTAERRFLADEREADEAMDPAVLEALRKDAREWNLDAACRYALAPVGGNPAGEPR